MKRPPASRPSASSSSTRARHAALTNLTRTHARRPRGERARGSVPGGRWERLTILAGLGLEGIIGPMSILAATDGAVFHAYRERVLLPELRRAKPDAVLVMDNPSRPPRPGPSARCSPRPGSPAITCRATRPTSTRSSRPGPR